MYFDMTGLILCAVNERIPATLVLQGREGERRVMIENGRIDDLSIDGKVGWYRVDGDSTVVFDICNVNEVVARVQARTRRDIFTPQTLTVTVGDCVVMPHDGAVEDRHGDQLADGRSIYRTS